MVRRMTVSKAHVLSVFSSGVVSLLPYLTGGVLREFNVVCEVEKFFTLAQGLSDLAARCTLSSWPSSSPNGYVVGMSTIPRKSESRLDTLNPEIVIFINLAKSF